ncbi:MAG: EAL domain-containing protein [Lachnospiraceae bacterium]|nr:EAL domain-containing protein [Lachnospiraceae bacterium]
MDAASKAITYYGNYTPVGDVLVLAICLVFVALIHTAYINRTRNFLYLRDMIVLLFASALADIIFHMLMNLTGVVPNVIIYLFRALFHLGLFGNLWLYVLYVKEPLHLEPEVNRRYFVIATCLYALMGLYELLGTLMRWGFYIDEAGRPHAGFPAFSIGYGLFVLFLLYIVIKNRERVFKQVVRGVVATTGIAILIMVVQQFYGQSSFTAATFLFPIFALLYLVHANPYDLEIGAVNVSAFEELIASSYAQKKELFLMSLFMHDFDGSGRKFPEGVQETMRFFITHFFKNSTLFQLSGGHIVLVVETSINPDYREGARKILGEFAREYERFGLDYKIVFTPTYNKISAENEYVALFHYMHGLMQENSFREVEDKDVKHFIEQKLIIKELADIQNKADIDDPRVEIYCQPVFNIKTGKYDTAEALMRLRLPELGLVLPERFIPIAESHKYINMLSRIILSKTCREIKQLTARGYYLKRISINFSVFDVREETFCSTVEKIIRESGIRFDQIAIEITESQSEDDFVIIKKTVSELKDTGIKFYLDDFGTGYSNFERIMELPFDIIKFDKSLVIASSTDGKLKNMVTHLARMFNDMDYAVLYEGVENDDDEERCVEMSAKYLQGFKYSKPIPIERLTEYFEKRAV